MQTFHISSWAVTQRINLSKKSLQWKADIVIGITRLNGIHVRRLGLLSCRIESILSTRLSALTSNLSSQLHSQPNSTRSPTQLVAQLSFLSCHPGIHSSLVCSNQASAPAASPDMETSHFHLMLIANAGTNGHQHQTLFS